MCPEGWTQASEPRMLHVLGGIGPGTASTAITTHGQTLTVQAPTPQSPKHSGFFLTWVSACALPSVRSTLLPIPLPPNCLCTHLSFTLHPPTFTLSPELTVLSPAAPFVPRAPVFLINIYSPSRHHLLQEAFLTASLFPTGSTRTSREEC
jgi:hypothetical protein